MNTSSKVAFEPEPKIATFPYADATALPSAASHVRRDGDHRLEDDSAQREQKAHEAGWREAEEQLRTAFASEILNLRDPIQQAVADFCLERKKYYERVEGEVVQLALAIARKILLRESQVDPLLLAGMVRVALEKIDSGTKVVLRVHPQQAGEWRTYLAQRVQPEEMPEILEDRTLEAERCVLETSLGTTELGIEVQLKEIEKGLLDLLAERPQAAS
jgi:flagellar assembly protein FliH